MKYTDEEILKHIKAHIDTHPQDTPAYVDYLSCVRNMEPSPSALLKHTKELKRLIREAPKEAKGKLFEVQRKVLCYEGPHSFDSFMLYNEIGRPLEEQFWLPRRKHLLTVCNTLQALEENELDELFLSMPPRVGKALADDTPVLTRKGWRRHGDLVVGDEVIGMSGEFKKVIAVHPKCELDVLIEFTNGDKIQCHENHEWMFYDRSCQRIHTEETKVYEKRRLESGPATGRGHRYTIQVPPHGYVIGEKKDLPLDPYTLGVWLGDGTNTNPTITSPAADIAIIEKVVSNGIELRWKTQHKVTGVWSYGFNIRRQLQTMGMCHSRRTTTKHIPQEYLTASIEQRLELLAGLIDTDGSLCRDGRYHFSTSEPELRDGFAELVSTFGWRAGIVEHEPHTSTKTVNGNRIIGKKKTWVVGFNADIEIPCALDRKRCKSTHQKRKVSVKSITRVEPKQGNCITVEGDGMYLVGRTMLPTHNSSLIMFFLAWVMGRNSERSNLYCSYTDSVVGVLYNGILEMLQDSTTYRYFDIFPSAKVVSTNAKDLLLNLDRKKRYASFTGRSLYGTLNGACDCNGYLIGDDLISGIEEAMSKDRLSGAWSKVDNNLLPRAKENAKVLWIGTRWSLIDPQGKRIDLLENDPKYKSRRWKVINTHALDPKTDESNFDYAYGVGFTTEYYQQRRASFERNSDMASWLAQYQGEPIEREGTVFAPDSLRYYNGVLPEGHPDRIFCAADVAYGGGDFTAAPILCQYDDDFYVVDVIYSNAEKNITQPLFIHAVKKYGIQAMKIEGTRMTAGYGQDIDRMLREEGIRINIQINTSHFTGRGKESRIFDKAPEIREHMIFLAEGHRSKEYQQFLNNLYSFTVTGKNKHDDAPDSCAMAMDFAYNYIAKAEVVKRPW